MNALLVVKSVAGLKKPVPEPPKTTVLDLKFFLRRRLRAAVKASTSFSAKAALAGIVPEFEVGGLLQLENFAGQSAERDRALHLHALFVALHSCSEGGRNEAAFRAALMKGIENALKDSDNQALLPELDEPIGSAGGSLAGASAAASFHPTTPDHMQSGHCYVQPVGITRNS